MKGLNVTHAAHSTHQGAAEPSLTDLIERSAELKRQLVAFAQSARFDRWLTPLLLEAAGPKRQLDEGNADWPPPNRRRPTYCSGRSFGSPDSPGMTKVRHGCCRAIPTTRWMSHRPRKALKPATEFPRRESPGAPHGLATLVEAHDPKVVQAAYDFAVSLTKVRPITEDTVRSQDSGR